MEGIMCDNLNVSSFSKNFPNEKSCEDFIVKSRWPLGICCPYCNNYQIYRLEAQKRFKCSSCRKQFTVRTGSVLAESKVSLKQWMKATWLLAKQDKACSVNQFAKDLGVTQKTAQLLIKRVKEAYSINNSQQSWEVEWEPLKAV